MVSGGLERASSPAWVAVAAASVISGVPVTTVGRVVATSRFSARGPFGGVFCFSSFSAGLTHFRPLPRARPRKCAQERLGWGGLAALCCATGKGLHGSPYSGGRTPHITASVAGHNPGISPLRNSVAQVYKICF